jgi:hypothetical protein
MIMGGAHRVTEYIFFGRILPERAPLTADFPQMQSAFADLGITFQCHLMIKDSQFIVPITLVQGSTDISTLKNLVFNYVSSCVNLIGYLQGAALHIDIVSAILPAQTQWYKFGTGIPVLQEAGTRPVRAMESRWVPAVLEETATGIVLEEFRAAIASAPADRIPLLPCN